jgi:hypothetical protein
VQVQFGLLQRTFGSVVLLLMSFLLCLYRGGPNTQIEGGTLNGTAKFATV